MSTERCVFMGVVDGCDSVYFTIGVHEHWTTLVPLYNILYRSQDAFILQTLDMTAKSIDSFS